MGTWSCYATPGPPASACPAGKQQHQQNEQHEQQQDDEEVRSQMPTMPTAEPRSRPPQVTAGSILGVWGHPDDETWLSAIHMARAVRAGQRVSCVTATRGEQGSPDPERWPPGEPLAKLRTEELDAALALLGVTEHLWLDYPDGGCADVPLAEGAQRVLTQLVRTTPDTVLTFGPDGMTGHPDHQSVSRWVDAALARYDGPPPLVLHATNTPEWLQRWRPTMDGLGVYMGAEPPVHARHELRSHLRLTPEETDLKVRALLCQASQVGPLIHAFGDDLFRTAMSEESFR
jgi:LmbE family N-acetylglucosaminyl deacetylase